MVAIVRFSVGSGDQADQVARGFTQPPFPNLCLPSPAHILIFFHIFDIFCVFDFFSCV